MQKLFQAIIVSCIVVIMCSFSCGQTGPTPPQIVVSFTQATPTGTSGPVVANCVYVGTKSGTYALPGTCSAGPVTSFTITNGIVRGTQYFIAVTAQYNPNGKVAESGYSNEVSAVSPVLNAPSNGAATSAEVKEPQGPAQEGQVGDLRVIAAK